MSENNLSAKHALVCGASEGIGLACAKALAQLGANVTVLARRQAVLQSVVNNLPKIHPQQAHAYLLADVAQTDLLEQLVKKLSAQQPIHILINNTAGPAPGSVEQASNEQFLDTFRKHLLANHVLVQACLPSMKSAGFGRIVNIISTSVKEPIANLAVSNTIRGAVANWSKTLAGEVGAFGITVNNVLPGYTRTARLDAIIADRQHSSGKSADDIIKAMVSTVPLQRFAEAEEIAAAVAFLASPAASYINGINLPVDGGRTRSL